MQSLFDVKKDDVDYYDVLGCVPSSSAEQIKTEYRRLALLHHPDKHEGQDCTYKKIKQAYDIVGDPVERAKYERWRLSGLQIPFEDFRQLSQHAQNVHWQALPSPLMLTDTSSESSGAQPSTFKPTSSDRLPRIHIQKQSFWSKPDAYDKFRNYTLDTHDYK